MDHEKTFTLAQLKADIDTAWEELSAFLSGLSEKQLTSPRDREGWTVKDHLTHLMAWEESVIVLFKGNPRHVGLGVDRALYAAGSFDLINASIQQQRKDIPIQSVMDGLLSTHEELMRRLDLVTDDDLNRPTRVLFPGAAADETRSLAGIVLDNTAEHFREHLHWIRVLCEGFEGRDPKCSV